MGFFSRNKEAVDTGRVSGAPFETVRRSPRDSRTRSPADTRFDAGTAPLDPAVTLKTRARRRLIGAVALALAAIVFVPMLFDRAPAPPSDDIALQIPDRGTPFEGRRGVPDGSRGPLKAAGDLPVVSASPPPVEQPPTAAGEPASQAIEKPIESAAPKSIVPEAPARTEKPVEPKKPEPAVEQSVEKPIEKPRAPAVVSTLPSTIAPGDDPHAVAALEGKPEPVVTSTSARGYAVQIAAYAAQEKARGMRDQLVAAGLKSYVESTSTPQGLRYRLRLGPFASRDAADKARAKLKTMKLDGSIVPL